MQTESEGEGSVAFDLALQETAPYYNEPSLQEKGEDISQYPRYAITCSSTIYTIEATIYNSSNSSVASGSWSCSAHSGSITSVPAGSNYKLVIIGKDTSGNITYRGETTGITVTAGQSTNAGTITINSFIPTLSSSSGSTLSSGSSLSLSWSGSSTGTTYQLQISTSSSFSTTNVADTTSSSSISLSSGTYYWRIRAIDSNDNKSDWSSARSFTVSSSVTGTITISSTTATITTSSTTTDTTAPSSPSVSIDSGATSTTSTSVTLTLSASDDVGVTGYYASETSTTPSASASGWTSVTSTTSYSGSVSFTLISGTGTKTVYVWFKDAAGNVSASASDSITLGSAPSTVTDIDGNVYNTVTIGTQVWMKENLKATKYRNGDAIPTTTASITNDSSSKYQWAYNDNESNVSTYGRLYTWYAVTDSRGVCPTGWHLPTDAEWTTLTDYLGGTNVAGGKMKEAGTSHWNSPNTSADNSSGWTALPGGYRYYNGASFAGIGNYGFWWSATEHVESMANSLRLADYESLRTSASLNIRPSVLVFVVSGIDY